jgi:lipoyl(octanoyl) transferase
MMGEAGPDLTRTPSGAPPLYVLELGLVDFTRALALQRRAALMRISGALPADLLILCEHPPVVTLGRSAKSAGHLLVTADALAARGAELHEIERGGDVTFHGPGQLVGYTIVDLKQHKRDLHWFLRQTEEAIIRAVAPFGVIGERNAGFTGVWVHGRKLASIGVHARDWVTWHGFALNVTTDLSWFDTIVPCGIDGVTMTSVDREMGAARHPDLARAVRVATAQAFASVFSLEVTELPEPLRVALERVAY